MNQKPWGMRYGEWKAIVKAKAAAATPPAAPAAGDQGKGHK